MSTHALAHPGVSSHRPLKLAGLLVVGAVAVTLFGLALIASLLGVGTITLGGAPERFGVSTLAESEIPPLYLSLYEQAARHYRLDWAILAGIGKVECDHGRDPDPSCTKQGAVNSAGAGGPAQFLASTWAEYGVDADGKGLPDRWDPADAIYAMANYLRASGAPKNYRKAIYAYNHAGWYVNEVEHWASLYRGSVQAAMEVEPGGAGEATEVEWPGVGAVETIPGTRALLSPGDGHLALAPAGAPAVVEAMVIAGNELQELPYGPDGHPDPLGAIDEDCSSTVNFVLYMAGIRPLAEILRENPLAQDYVNWGDPGPGRWVTIYATTEPTDHVFMVIAGLRLDTSYKGTDVGPNRDEGGPRWRILDRIPTWAHWSVRHPPGL
ncbi:MAG TPA: lytic transglycosylase domain-containing protein [Solirubrobacteraceae bacterium]|nr:lytic transglycosylase domain-containing protein [Solirubrobacteraceae bacterium]